MPTERLIARIARDGWKAEVIDVANGETFPTAFRLTGNPRVLFKGDLEQTSIEIDTSFSAQLDSTSQENLALISKHLAPESRKYSAECVALYEINAFVRSWDVYILMERFALHLACCCGGLYEDPQKGETMVLRRNAACPPWRRPPTVEDEIGPLGVEVRDWAMRKGYTIPRAFLSRRCERYVLLITSFDPPKVNGRTFTFETELLPHLSEPPPGYVYRVFDFEDRVELVRAGTSLHVAGPIPGLPEHRLST